MKSDRGVYLRGQTWCIRYADQNGKLHREAVSPSKAIAQRAYVKRKAAIAEGKFFPELARRGVTFDEIVADAEEQRRRDHAMKFRGTRPFADYRFRIVLGWFRGRPANSITAAEINDKLNENFDVAATWNQHRLCLSKVFGVAIDNGKVSKNPALDKLVRLKKLNNDRIRYLNQESDEDEETRLRAAIAKLCPGREAEFDLALFTGVRKAEQYRARWRDVDWKHKLITIPIAKSGKREYVRLNRPALSALAQLRRRYAPNDESVSEKLVCGETAEQEHREWWDAFKAHAQVKNLHWHDLRHTYARRLVMADVNILTVKELMRHSNVTVTLKYAHLAPSHLDEALEKLEKFAPATGTPTDTRTPERTSGGGTRIN